MFRSIISSRRFIVLLLISVFVIFFLFPELQKRPIYFMIRPVVFLISRLQEGLMLIVQGVDGVWSGYLNLIGVEEENLKLREELHRLQSENIELLESRAALERLEQLFLFKKQNHYPMVAARVMGRDSTNWYRSLMIDKGERDGVTVDMGVIVPSGAVGRVIKTAPDHSQVLLLTDRNSAIAALVQRTRDEGILEGTGDGSARIKYLSTLSELQAGDLVVTSGLAGSFPKGILIGQIHRVDKPEMALFQQAEIIPSVNFSKLEEVLVILSSAGGTSGGTKN